MSEILDYIAELFGSVMGVGIAEITVIFGAVIIALLVLMLLSASGHKRLLRRLADETAGQNYALLEEFRKITLALHEEAMRSESSANSPARGNAPPPPAAPVHPSEASANSPAKDDTQPSSETPIHPSLIR